MILRDKITIMHGTGPEVVRAHVGVVSGALEGNSDNGYAFIEELRAIVKQDDRVGYLTIVWWRGEEFYVSEPPLVRRKSGRDHHMTVKLKRQSV